jgi:hypothetical protein
MDMGAQGENAVLMVGLQMSKMFRNGRIRRITSRRLGRAGGELSRPKNPSVKNRVALSPKSWLGASRSGMANAECEEPTADSHQSFEKPPQVFSSFSQFF